MRIVDELKAYLREYWFELYEKYDFYLIDTFSDLNMVMYGIPEPYRKMLVDTIKENFWIEISEDW